MSNTVARKISPVTTAGPSQGMSLYAADGGRKYLNQTERRRALVTIESLEPDKALFALTLVWTGARVSEVLALTPASFQIEEGLVSIVTLKRRRFCVREVPIPTTLMCALNAWFGLRAVQLDPDGEYRRLWPWHRTTAWRYIKAIMRAARIIGRPACARGMRHGFGVGTLQAGVPLSLLQRWLGHAQIRTTAIYADVSGTEERAFAERFWRAAV